jgi:hypothetical protein
LGTCERRRIRCRHDADAPGDDDRGIDVALAPDEQVLEYGADAGFALSDPLARLLADDESELKGNVPGRHEMLAGVGERGVCTPWTAVKACRTLHEEWTVLERRRPDATAVQDVVSLESSPAREPRPIAWQAAGGVSVADRSPFACERVSDVTSSKDERSRWRET